MANNITVKDQAGASVVLKTTDNTNVHTPHHIVDTLPGGITGFAEDAAHTTADVGIEVLAVRTDAGTALAGTTGDYIPLTTDALGRLWIAGSAVEDAAHTSGDRGVAVLSVRQDAAAALAGSDADYQPIITDASGRLWVNVGAAAVDSLPGGITGRAEDAAFSNAHVGVPVYAVRRDAVDGTVPGQTDGDYSTVNVDATGRLWVHSQSEGLAASGAAPSGNPVAIAAVADTTNPSAVDDGDLVAPLATTLGKLVVVQNTVPELVSKGSPSAITDTNAVDVLAASGGSLKWYITSIFVSNSHGTVGTLVTIQDDDNAVLWRGYAGPLGGGFHQDFPVPLPATTANKKIQAVCGTTGTNTYVNVVAFKAP